jgi:tetraacyldisaccharide 4'-kinase
LPVPVWVIGNVVVGGAGKTPAVLALIDALRRAGHRPGVVSRGYGRVDNTGAVRVVNHDDDAGHVGDEALLLRRRGRVPVFVATDRHAAALALLQANPEVDVVLADDGLQHTRLPRQLEIVVFDERGIGNGLLLPAGPLREAWPSADAGAQGASRLVLYNANHPSLAWPGAMLERQLARAWPLAAWWQGNESSAVPLTALHGRPLLALAGLAAPEKFFAMAEAAGLSLKRLPQPDHARYLQPPWPPGTHDVVTTEKDAVKLRPEWAAEGDARKPAAARESRPRIWVLPLDSCVPEEWFAAALARTWPQNLRTPP